MNYQEFKPTGILKDFIQCYFICETEANVLSEDNVFASGVLEIMFNLGTTNKQFNLNGTLVTEPNIQLWGQVLKPMVIKSFGKHSMFGIRFFSHTAACFFAESIEEFNDAVFNLEDIIGNKINLLHERLLESDTLSQKIELTECFLIERLLRFDKKKMRSKLNLTNAIMQELQKDNRTENMEAMALRYGISSRYLQKIFLHYSGLTPQLYRKISRFQKSLYLVADKNSSLTSIAHDCGYFDQSHFIKDFKKFTGTTPSDFQPESSTELLAYLK
jgi:AraC-like DNA-binding protein